MMSERTLLYVSLLIVFFGSIFVNAPPVHATDVGGSINSNTTWTLAGSPYVVISNVTVNFSATLTIQPGVVVKFNSGLSLFIANGSRLNAQGTSGSKITFTSIKDDTVGGDTNGDGNATSPARGDWGVIDFTSMPPSPGGTLDYCVFRYGGGKTGYPATIRFSGTNVASSISNSIIEESSTQGVFINSVTTNTPAISGCNIVNNTNWGIWYSSSTANLTGNSFGGNADGAVVCNGSLKSISHSGNTISSTNGSCNGIGVEGSNTLESVTWQADSNFPYVVTNDITLGNASSSNSLTVNAGAVVKFSSGKSITMGATSRFYAQGTSGSKITFTSIKDDTVGGDTNGDGNATTPARGDWGVIDFNGLPSPGGTMEYCVFRYGGGKSGYPATIRFSGTNVASGITNSTVEESSTQGIFINSVTTNPPTISGCEIVYNTNWGILYSASTINLTGTFISHNGDGGLVAQNSSTGQISSCYFTRQATGILCQSSSNPTIGGSEANANTFTGNTSYGVQNTTSTVTVNANTNWWGSLTGPHHSTLNPPGTGDEVSDYVSFPPWLDEPTVVDLALFSAKGFEDGVVLEWRTASERNNAGFHLWRSEIEYGHYARITPASISAEGGATFGAAYNCEDVEVNAGKTYYYRLQAIDYAGKKTLYDPVSATVGGISLLYPENAARVGADSPPTFTWLSHGFDLFQLQFSRDADFKSRIISLPKPAKRKDGSLKSRWTREQLYTPSAGEWNTVTTLRKNGKPFYWRVYGENEVGHGATSEANRIKIK